MIARQLKPQQPLPIFDIPNKYRADEWDIKEWDIYKNAPSKRKCNWTIRSGTTNYKFRFSLCENPHIVEELKYFMYYLIEIKNVTITTFAEYYDRYKILARYVNVYMSKNTSILELDDLSVYEFYLSTHIRNNPKIKGGLQISGDEFKRVMRNSRFTTLITYAQSVLREYYEKDIPETEKLIWRANRLPFCKESNTGKTLDFREIKNPRTLKNVQDFCIYQLSTANITFNAVYSYLLDLRLFIKWLDQNNPITNLDKLKREDIEKYALWLRTCGKFPSRRINAAILNLKVFLEWGQLLDKKYMPQDSLVLNSDYAFKTKKESKYLTDQEVKALINVIPQMPKLYGKMTYCLLFLGMRFSELAKLDVNALQQNDDGTYYLDLWQYKTNAICEKPVFKNCIKIIRAEIEKNQKRFGKENVKYVFVTNKNRPVTCKTLNDNIKKVIIKNNIRGRDGKLLHCTSHCFRATVATNLISQGVTVDVAAQLLGQTTLSSLSHYATITADVVKDQLRPRIEKDQMLITNIGKIDKLNDIPMENAVALCNGFCNKNPLTTPCAKANACFSCPLFIPSKQYLNSYHLQLLEIEATIKIAEANDYMMMLKKALEEKAALEKIISKLENKEENHDS